MIISRDRNFTKIPQILMIKIPRELELRNFLDLTDIYEAPRANILFHASTTIRNEVKMPFPPFLFNILLEILTKRRQEKEN